MKELKDKSYVFDKEVSMLDDDERKAFIKACKSAIISAYKGVCAERDIAERKKYDR